MRLLLIFIMSCGVGHNLYFHKIKHWMSIMIYPRVERNANLYNTTRPSTKLYKIYKLYKMHEKWN